MKFQPLAIPNVVLITDPARARSYMQATAASLTP
jgi:hypothetical protein